MSETPAVIDDTKDWEVLIGGDHEITDRLRIPGGWLYRTRCRLARSVAMVFVPERG